MYRFCFVKKIQQRAAFLWYKWYWNGKRGQRFSNGTRFLLWSLSLSTSIHVSFNPVQTLEYCTLLKFNAKNGKQFGKIIKSDTVSWSIIANMLRVKQIHNIVCKLWWPNFSTQPPCHNIANFRSHRSEQVLLQNMSLFLSLMWYAIITSSIAALLFHKKAVPLNPRTQRDWKIEMLKKQIWQTNLLNTLSSATNCLTKIVWVWSLPIVL